MSFTSLPALRSELQSGLFAGITTRADGTHAAVILLPYKPAAPLPWPDAMAWAKNLGGELPSRPVAALLCATAADQFEADQHWTADDHAGDGDLILPHAWLCDFAHAFHETGVKEYEALARAVRLVPLVA